ncbi:MAG: hypothetical protein ACI3XO_09405 [Eubacteriales bacterium]
MKSIKKLTALTLAVIMLLSAILSTSAYVFEISPYTEYFTSLPGPCRQSHIYVDFNEWGGDGEPNDFDARTIFIKSTVGSTYAAYVTVVADLVCSENEEIYTVTDTQYCDPLSYGISATVDGSVIDSEFSIIAFSADHTIKLYNMDSNGNLVYVTTKVISGSTTS